MDDLYHEIILDHAREPRNKGVIEHATLTIKGTNASCGDSIEMQFVITDGKITDLKWSGDGCAISTASTSIASELVMGKSVKEAKNLSEEVLMAEMGLTRLLPTREKCLLLPLRVLAKLEEK